MRRSKQERIITTASVTTAEAGASFITGYYATTIIKNILKQYLQ
ncbi:MAG: hypothetical protein ACLFN8_02805 [Candidatus Woesearchaeota archaeon]